MVKGNANESHRGFGFDDRSTLPVRSRAMRDGFSDAGISRRLSFGTNTTRANASHGDCGYGAFAVFFVRRSKRRLADNAVQLSNADNLPLTSKGDASDWNYVWDGNSSSSG